MKTVLLIGYGNPGRQDDGLGPAVAAYFEKVKIPGLSVDSDYQLTVEDAYDVSQHDLVIFVDASVDSKEPFDFYLLDPKEQLSFSSHSVSAECVLSLSVTAFQKAVPGYMLAIRGYSFDHFTLEMTDPAKANFEKAISFIEEFIRRYISS